MKEFLDKIENMPVHERQVIIQNKVMDTHYNVMFLALVEELGEYVASLGYQDWKVVPRDELNLIVELADICIFAMNCEFYDRGRSGITPVKADHCHLGFSPDIAFVDEIMSMIVHKEFETIPSFIVTNHPEVLYAIEAKQALNLVRQAFGYKEGKYVKNWDGQEDNVYMMELFHRGERNIVAKIFDKAKACQRN